MELESYRGIPERDINESRFTSDGRKYTLNHSEKLVIDMHYKGIDSANTNTQGWERSGKKFFKELMAEHPEFFSKRNRMRIDEGLAPVVDKVFIDNFPEYKEFEKEKIIHHHIGGDGQAVAVPQSMHRGYGDIHIAEKDLGIRDNAKIFSDRCALITKDNPEMFGKSAGDFKDYIIGKTKIYEEKVYAEEDVTTELNSFINSPDYKIKNSMRVLGHILEQHGIVPEVKDLGVYMSKGGQITVVNVDGRIKDDLCQQLQEQKMGYLEENIPGKEAVLFVPTGDVDKLKAIEADLLKDKGLNCVQMSINDLCQNAEKADELVSRKNPTQIIEIRGLTEEDTICLQEKCKGISQDFQIGVDRDGNGRYNFAIKESQAFSMNPEVKDFAKSYLDATVDTYGAKNEIKSDILFSDKEFAAGLENLNVERGEEPKYIVGKNCNDRYIEVTDKDFSLYSYSTKDNEITRNCLETVDRSSPDYLYRLTACSMDIKDCEVVDKNGLKDNLLNEHHAVQREDLNVIRKDEMTLTDKINEIVKTKMQKDPKFMNEKDSSVLLGAYMNQCKSILDDISNNINPKGLTHDQVDDIYNFIDNSSLNCKEYRDCKKVFDRFDSDIYQCNDRDKHFEMKMDKNPIKEISKDTHELERMAR